MSQGDITPDSGTGDNPPPNNPPAPDPAPPAAPEPPAPAPVPDSGNDGDRLSRVESMVTNLTETVTGLLDAITGSNDEKPQKLPWTAWGSRNKS